MIFWRFKGFKSFRGEGGHDSVVVAGEAGAAVQVHTVRYPLVFMLRLLFVGYITYHGCIRLIIRPEVYILSIASFTMFEMQEIGIKSGIMQLYMYV